MFNNNLLSARLTSSTDYSLQNSEISLEDVEDINTNQKEESNQESDTETYLQKVNDLTKKELQMIDGVGEVYSQKIIEAENIETTDDLEYIDGIGEITADKIEEFVRNLEENLKNKEDEENKEKQKEDKDKNEEEVVVKKEELIKLAELIDELKEREEKVIKSEDDGDGSEEERKELEKVDINKAGEEELQEITGIGPAYAERIIENRPFCRLDELTEVSGIGESTLENIKDQDLAKVDECKTKNKNEEDKDGEGEDNEDQDKEGEKIEGLKEEISILEEDYSDLRASLRDAERSLREIKSNHEDELITVQRQRDRCRYPDQININKADESDLKILNNVGESRAKDIFESDNFETLEELTNVTGIGEGTIENWIREGVACTWGEQNGGGDGGDDSDDSDDGGESGDDDDDDGGDGDESEDEDGEEDQELEKVEINSATKEQLIKIYGVGSSIAEKILDYRETDFFCALSDLTEINGLGESTLESIKDEGLATIDPPTDCFENQIKIVDYPEEVFISEENNLDIKFLDFKNLDYQITIKIISGDILVEKTKELNLDEEKLKTFSFRLNEDLEIGSHLDLMVEVKNEGELVATKEISEFSEIKDQENYHLITFVETGNIEGVTINIFKDDDHLVEDLTGQEGQLEKELALGDYRLEASKLGYESIEKEFTVEDIDRVEFGLIKKELIKNNNFENWTDESPDGWTLDNQSGKSEGGKLQLGPHDYMGPYGEVANFNHQEAEGKEITYKLEAQVKGKGFVQLGLVRPGYTNARYGDWELIDGDDWTTIEYEISKDVRDQFNPQGEFIIRHTSCEETAGKEVEMDKLDIKVDSVSLTTT